MATSKCKQKEVSCRFHQGNCGPCFLCGRYEDRYDHFSGLPLDVQHYIEGSVGSCSISANGCVCRSHRKEAQRNMQNPQHCPTWAKEEKNKNTAQKCVYSECSANSHSKKIIVPTSTTKAALIDLLDTTQPITICERHYQQLYRQTNKCNACACCGAMPKARHGDYTRHSPDAIAVSSYLTEYTEFGMTFSANDAICKSCYNMHLTIIQRMEKQDNIRELQSDLMIWAMTVEDKHTNALTRAILLTVIFVAKMLKNDKALLLPHAVNVFQTHYSALAGEDSNMLLELGDSTIAFSARWLLSQLIIHLQPYMNYRCVVK